MNKYTKQALTLTQKLCKQAEELLESEYGHDIQKDAEKTVDRLINDGIVAPENRDTTIERLTYDKHASCDGLRKMAEMLKDAYSQSAPTPSLGETEKSASTIEEESADDYYKRKFG